MNDHQSINKMKLFAIICAFCIFSQSFAFPSGNDEKLPLLSRLKREVDCAATAVKYGRAIGSGSGAAAGAAAGAALGSVVPGLGTLIGMGVGFFFGSAAGTIGAGIAAGQMCKN